MRQFLLASDTPYLPTAIMHSAKVRIIPSSSILFLSSYIVFNNECMTCVIIFKTEITREQLCVVVQLWSKLKTLITPPPLLIVDHCF